MIVANFYHLKNTNGLFYYGVDYLAEDLGQVRKVLVRPALQQAAVRAFPGVDVLACSPLRLLMEVFQASRRGDFVYTPSSHPLPFLSRQMVVVHDVFPFFGRLGAIKKLLLRISLATSRCRVGYINNTGARPMVHGGLGVSTQQGIYAPNKFPARPATPAARPARNSHGITVGLFGTDSSKKNYAELFAALGAKQPAAQVRFLMYGHRTEYYEAVIARFPSVSVELIESDRASLGDFFRKLDLVVSVADHEGFGRPIAAALLAGIPCLLVNRPVFQEFFQNGAEFAGDVDAVAERLVALAAGATITANRFDPPVEVVQGYHDAVAFLHSQAAAGR